MASIHFTVILKIFLKRGKKKFQKKKETIHNYNTVLKETL